METVKSFLSRVRLDLRLPVPQRTRSRPWAMTCKFCFLRVTVKGRDDRACPTQCPPAALDRPVIQSQGRIPSQAMGKKGPGQGPAVVAAGAAPQKRGWGTRAQGEPHRNATPARTTHRGYRALQMLSTPDTEEVTFLLPSITPSSCPSRGQVGVPPAAILPHCPTAWCLWMRQPRSHCVTTDRCAELPGCAVSLAPTETTSRHSAGC